MKTYNITVNGVTYTVNVEEVSGAASAPAAAPAAVPATEICSTTNDGILLFATATCPNCKVAGALLDKAGVVFTKLIAEENPELVRAYGIKQAPTLTVIEGGEYVNYKGVSDIKKFIETLS